MVCKTPVAVLNHCRVEKYKAKIHCEFFLHICLGFFFFKGPQGALLFNSLTFVFNLNCLCFCFYITLEWSFLTRPGVKRSLVLSFKKIVSSHLLSLPTKPGVECSLLLKD